MNNLIKLKLKMLNLVKNIQKHFWYLNWKVPNLRNVGLGTCYFTNLLLDF